MKIKRIQAANMSEAMRLVKAELGENAVIISTRKIRKTDEFGISSEEIIEIEASANYDEEYEPFHSSRKTEVNQQYNENFSVSQEIINLKKLLGKNVLTIQEVKNEIPKIKNMLQLLMKHSGIFASDSPENKLYYIYEDMIKQEIKDKIAYQILENMSSEFDNLNSLNIEEIKKLVKIKMRNKIKIFKAQKKKSGPKIVAFIGPTGVGKTTTLAKIAAKCRLINKKKTALFTFDTYRIAAAEQLKIYGKILKTPVIAINNQNELKEKLNSFKDYEYIFIDTAGKNQKDSSHIKKLKEHLNVPMDIHLVLSTTTKIKDLDDIVSRFSLIHYSSLLFTKLDESSTYGNIYNIAFETGKPLSYFSTGQRVPEDIEVASKDKIIDIILKNNQ